MQVFRLVGSGMVDRVIAFDELPERFVQGLEMRSPEGLTPGWFAWLPKIKKRVPGMKFALMNGNVQVVPERIEEGPFFYLLEHISVNRDRERWRDISDFVRRAVDLTMRLPDKLEDLAIPLADSAKTELKIHDPANEVPVIKIPEAFQEKAPALILPPAVQEAKAEEKEEEPEVPAKPVNSLACPDCGKEFTGKPALRMHRLRGHPVVA